VAATVGVTLFFALSGYLITALLLGEWADRGRIDLIAFYGRRARRLLPALVLLLVALAALAALRGELGPWLRGAWPVALYVGNWGYLAGIVPSELTHTWSLAIEEQFYLLWPAALLVALGSGGLPRGRILAIVIIAVSFVLIIPNFPGMGLAYYGSPERAKDLLLGGFVAMLSMSRGRDVSPSNLWMAVSVGVLVAMSMAWVVGLTVAGLSSLLVPVPCAVVVAWVAARPHVMAWRPLRFTGRISYGLYLYHFRLVGLAAAPVLFGATYALAALSWFGVERRLLAARHHASPSTHERSVTFVQPAPDPSL
jgi:peptidoglycan/LPS O-acetylase OafA/YrhL